MKRLRLRGDWSDTGPNARPEGEETVSNEDSFVQRMSGYLTRWIEESIQEARRQRRRSPIVARRDTEGDTANDEDHPEQSDEGNTSETLESSVPLTEECRDDQRTETSSDSEGTDVTDNGNDVTTNIDDVANNKCDVTDDATSTPSNVNEASICENTKDSIHVKRASPSRDSTTKSRDHDEVTNSHSRDLKAYSETRKRNNFRKQHRKRNSAFDTSRNKEPKTESCDGVTSCDESTHENVTYIGNHSNEMCNCEPENAPSGNMKSQNEISRSKSNNQTSGEGLGTKASDNKSLATMGTRTSHPEEQSTEIDVPTVHDEDRLLSAETQNSEAGTTESEAMDFNTQESQDRSVENLDSKVLSPDGTNNNLANETTQNSTTRKEPSEAEISENSTPPGVSTRVTIPLNTNSERSAVTPAMETRSSEAVTENHEDDVDESPTSVADDSRRDAAASTIQNFFRFRVKKDFQTIPCDLPVHSDVKQVFKGHRNARTMVSYCKH